MKKPEALVQLIEELRGESVDSQVETIRESKAVLYPNDEAASDDNGITLTGEDCRLLFANEVTIERLFEALADPPDASLALFDVTIPGQILDVLERRFTAVDEG